MDHGGVVMSVKDGGPAFPQRAFKTDYNAALMYSDGAGGMSLRDWYAGMALQGLLASYANDRMPTKPSETVSGLSFIIADAMLAARGK